eukprot:7242-Heterococcus_DN1.PRE.2
MKQMLAYSAFNTHVLLELTSTSTAQLSQKGYASGSAFCAMAGSNVMESNMQGIIDAPLTMSGVIKELQVLKDKFKNEDDEEGA